MYEDQEDVNHLESSDQNQEQIEQQPSAEAEEEVGQQETSAASQEDKQQPFHEHPRFKELVEQKNQFKQQVELSQRQMQELQRQLESLTKSQQANQPKPQDELMERLKGIDPAFAERFSKISEVDALKEKLDKFEQWQAEQAQNAVRTQVQSTVEKLFTEHKVSPEMREIYDAQITMAAQRDPNLGINDLPNLFKNIHEKMSKLLESTKRETTKTYVASKQAAASKPQAQPKGKPASPNSASKYSRNPEEARASVVQNILKQIKAEKDI